MSEFLEIDFISPIYMDHKPDNETKGRYFLTFVSFNTANDSPIINKIVLDELSGVTSNFRGYIINKTVKIDTDQYPTFKINLFRYDHITNKIYLLFTGALELNKVDSYNKSTIILKSVKNILGEKTFLRNAEYHDHTSFLDEQFFNFDVSDNANADKCVLFFVKLNASDVDTVVIKPDEIDVKKARDRNNIYVFDRYDDCIVKENIPDYVKRLLSSNSKLDTIQYTHDTSFIKKFGSHHTKEYYETYQPNTNRGRDLKKDPYKNNIVVSPSDARVRAFKTQDSLTFKLYNGEFNIKKLLLYNGFNYDEIKDGYGFFCRKCPQDYHTIYVPYSGSLKNFMIKRYDNDSDANLIKTPYYMIFRFESNYFMPPDVHERNYLAALYGNYMYGGVGVGSGMREAPELLEVQPDTKLVFYVILIASRYNNSIQLTNKKLLDPIDPRKIGWFEQGEEIGLFKYECGSVIVLFNRPMSFTPDIENYSRINSYIDGDQQMDCLVRGRDTVSKIL